MASVGASWPVDPPLPCRCGTSRTQDGAGDAGFQKQSTWQRSLRFRHQDRPGRTPHAVHATSQTYKTPPPSNAPPPHFSAVIPCGR